MDPRSKEESRSRKTLSDATLAPLDKTWVDDMLAIERRSYARPWTKESIEAVFLENYPCFGCVTKDKQLAGYLIIETVADEVHVLNIAVHPDFRRQGVAKSLLTWIHQREFKKGARVVHLEVARTNESALKLYKSLGYQQVGARKRYYQDLGEDALLLTKNLNGPS